MHNHAGSAVRARQILAGTINDARKSLLQLVLFDVLFKAASLALLTPLTAALFRFLVGRSGNHAIGNTDPVNAIRFSHFDPTGLSLAPGPAQH